MPLGSSALPQISRPFEVLGSRTAPQISWPLERAWNPHAGQPAPTCPRDARQLWAHGSRAAAESRPWPPDSLLAGLAVGGHGRALAPFGVHAAPSRRHQGPHLSGGAAGGACRSHSYPASRASTPRAPRGHRGHHPRGGAPHGRGAAAAAAALALATGLFSSSLPSARAVPGSARPLLLPRARPRPPPPRRPRAPLLKGRWRVHGWVPLSGPWAERARAVPARVGRGGGSKTHARHEGGRPPGDAQQDTANLDYTYTPQTGPATKLAQPHTQL